MSGALQEIKSPSSNKTNSKDLGYELIFGLIKEKTETKAEKEARHKRVLLGDLNAIIQGVKISISEIYYIYVIIHNYSIMELFSLKHKFDVIFKLPKDILSMVDDLFEEDVDHGHELPLLFRRFKEIPKEKRGKIREILDDIEVKANQVISEEIKSITNYMNDVKIIEKEDFMTKFLGVLTYMTRIVKDNPMIVTNAIVSMIEYIKPGSTESIRTVLNSPSTSLNRNPQPNIETVPELALKTNK